MSSITKNKIYIYIIINIVIKIIIIINISSKYQKSYRINKCSFKYLF